jgi:hypothetical protein
LGTAEVTIDQPAPNTSVSGKAVVVRGSARAALGQLSRAEITLAGTTKVDTSDPTSSMQFGATFDLSDVAPGPTSLRVVACGTSGLAGSLARGETEIRLTVQAPPATSTTAPRPATTVRSAPLGAGAGAAAGATASTTSLPVPTTQAGQSSTTSTSTPATTVAEAPPRPVTAKSAPARPRSADGPTVLTDAPADRSSRPPLWVGAVVGVSGGLGLLFSAFSSRRRNRVPEAAELLEPEESDLVDVR